MLENFRPYFAEIGMPEPTIARAEQVCGLFAGAIHAPPRAVVVCDLIEPDGARRYKNLWLRVGNYVVEIKEFVTQQHVDLTLLGDAVWIDFERNDLVSFDGQTTPTTALNVKVQFRHQLIGHLFSAHNNCKHLYDFALAHLMPSHLPPP